MLDSLIHWYQRLKSGAARVAPPLEGDQRGHWDHTADVVVIGFGAAGASAALEALDAGASVTVLDRFNGGGSTAISGGIVYAGGGTAIQRQAGVDDTPKNLYNYLRQETGDVVCETTLRQFCDGSAATIDWLMAQGVPFEASLCPFKTSYPSNRYYFYYSGNESFPPFSDYATPAPRGHRAHGKGVSGAALFGPMRRACAAGGARILTQHRAIGLIRGRDNAVLGVQVAAMPPHTLSTWLHRQLYALLIYLRYAAMYAPLITWTLRAALGWLEARCSRPLRLRATGGVIISSGGFFFNRDMVQQYAPFKLPGMPLGTIGDDGSGILIGQSVGGATALMDQVSDWRFINPPQAFVRGILIDGQGRRVCNEMLYGAQLAERINSLAGGRAWLLLDAALARQALREIGPSRAMWFQSAAALMYLALARRKAPTLDKLAAKLGVPADTLRATVEGYNAVARDGEQPDPLGKPRDYLAPLARGPWYALDCRIGGMVRNPSLTLGGLRVDASTGMVQDEHGAAIAGLYAAGRAAVGIASHGYVSGLSIADCIFSGRRAGRHAAGWVSRAAGSPDRPG